MPPCSASWPRATANWCRCCAACVASRSSGTPGRHRRGRPATERAWRAAARRPGPGPVPGAEGGNRGFPFPCTALSQREWVAAAIRKIEADFNRSADTHLIPMPLPGYPGIDVYLKDESSHPTGSLKHRLARSLFLYALANGWLHEGSTVVEASSG